MLNAADMLPIIYNTFYSFRNYHNQKINKCPDYKNDDELMSGYKSFEFINNSGILNECFCEMLTSLLLLNGDGEILRTKTINFFGIHVQIGAAKLGRFFF